MTAVHLAHGIEGPEDAPWVVLGNSLGANRGMWDAQAEVLARRWRVLRYEHRGHVGSDVPPGPYSLAALAGDVLALLEALGVQRMSFCGLSLGGMVGMWLAANAPERIERLVVCCSSPRMEPASTFAERAAAVREAGSVGAIADAVVDKWLTPEFASRHPDVRGRLRSMLVAQPAEGYASCCEAIAEMDLRGELARVSAPTLVIAGAQDRSTPPELHARLIAEGIPGARLEVLDPAAHVAVVEQAQTASDLIAAHLEAT